MTAVAATQAAGGAVWFADETTTLSEFPPLRVGALWAGRHDAGSRQS